MAIVHIGIGSNIGDRRANCMKAIKNIKNHDIDVKKISSPYETKPWGIKDQPDFINMTVEAETSLSPEELLKVLKDIEKEMGREDSVRWGPRLIDLDILFYDDRVIDIENLRIPHPLLYKRDFVLLPLSEIAPDKIHPLFKKTVKQLKEEMKNDKNTDS
ncbi:MAG: 2-amino-4-hydroxy-6-hydroxymethyldihydropteridine diphosphokinase [Thermodesulfovibrio sp.]|nr:2-amino-4-hydroxy-6-hydroxymethyldihydropteridine diphosphokinase [Thermodesulfovibrio sp.]